MLHLITGTPGAKKTAFTVSKLDKVEADNKVNLVKNRERFKKNLPLFEKYKDDFAYYVKEVGTGHDLKQVIEVLSEDYFEMFTLEEFEDDLRPDDYFLRVVQYNEICERIAERDSVTSFIGLLPVRTIYANIKALKIDNVRSLTYDWRECPDGSIIVIDEVQLVAPYDNLKDRNNEIIQDLTIHRHRGFDFYFITQAPILLHPTVQVLIGLHWHLTVPFGWRTRVYQWGSIRTYPNTLVNKLNCEKKFDFSPSARIFKLYKSTTINTHEKRFPWKPAIAMLLLVLACGFVIVKNLHTARNSELLGGKGTPLSATSVTSKPVTSAVSATAVTSATVPTPLQVEQQKQKIEQKYLTNYDVEVAENDNIRPAMLLIIGGKCRAFNQFGDNLDVSQDLCRLMMKDNSLIPRSRKQEQGQPQTLDSRLVQQKQTSKPLDVPVYAVAPSKDTSMPKNNSTTVS